MRTSQEVAKFNLLLCLFRGSSQGLGGEDLACCASVHGTCIQHNRCGFDSVDDWNDPTPLCFQVKAQSKEASVDLRYPVPVLGITPVGTKVFIQIDYQNLEKI